MEKKKESQEEKMDGGDHGWGNWPTGISYAGGAHDKVVFNGVMLRFRPIAPKPANGVSDQVENFSSPKKRVKRKYVRVCKNNSNKGKNKIKKIESAPDLDQEKGQGGEDVQEDNDRFKNGVTLQLLPQRGDSDHLKGSISEEKGPTWCNYGGDYCYERGFHGGVSGGPAEQDGGVLMAVKSWVTVECVTDMSPCMKGWLERNDMEGVMRNLDGDTCPGFISDGSNNVQWVNMAYKRMVASNLIGVLPEVRVWLLVKEKEKKNVEPYLDFCGGFSCWVRVQYYYTWQQGKERWGQKVLPCDVGRMGCGGFAWRLDVKAALSLGR